MSMKGKPNTAHFQPAKDPTAFLEGGEADRADSSTVGLTTAKPSLTHETPRRGRGRVQKIFNFPEDLADRLRETAQRRTREKGGRVTEKDIVVEALEAFLKTK